MPPRCAVSNVGFTMDQSIESTEYPLGRVTVLHFAKQLWLQRQQALASQVYIFYKREAQAAPGVRQRPGRISNMSLADFSTCTATFCNFGCLFWRYGYGLLARSCWHEWLMTWEPWNPQTAKYNTKELFLLPSLAFFMPWAAQRCTKHLRLRNSRPSKSICRPSKSICYSTPGAIHPSKSVNISGTDSHFHLFHHYYPHQCHQFHPLTLPFGPLQCLGLTRAAKRLGPQADSQFHQFHCLFFEKSVLSPSPRLFRLTTTADTQTTIWHLILVLGIW